MLRNIFVMFVLSVITSYFGIELLEALPQLVNKSYQPNLFDLGWFLGFAMVFSPGIPVMFLAMMIQMNMDQTK